MFRLGSLKCLAIVALSASLATVAVAQDQPQIVKVGVLSSTGDVTLHLAEREGFFKQEGIRLDMVPFKSGGQMVASVGTGELDVAAGVVAAGLSNLEARGGGLRIVSDRASMPPGHGYMQFLVRKDLVESGKYKTYADLKGMTLATQSKGGAAESTLNELLKLGGLTLNDVNIVYLGHADIATGLGSKAVDAAFVTEPNATIAVQRGSAIKIVNGDEIYPNDVLGVMVYSQKFINDKGDLPVRFMRAFLRGCRIYNDAYTGGKLQDNPAAEKVIAAFKSYIAISDEQVLRQMVPHGCDPDGKLNLAGMKKDYAFFKAQGTLKGDVDLDRLVDMTFADKAAKDLGPYKAP